MREAKEMGRWQVTAAHACPPHVRSLPVSFLQGRWPVGTRAGTGMASPHLPAACGSVLRTPACCGAGEVRQLVLGLSNAVWQCFWQGGS